jgi:hypothetical protein
MNENKFQITRIARWREETKELFNAMGLRRQQYESMVGELADLATEKVISKASQFLFDFDSAGSMALAERHNVSDRTIRNWRRELVEMKIGKNKAA